jgi:hypothetical protein
MIRSEHMKSCLTAQIRYMLFEGPGPFKKKFEIGGNVDELKAYRLIPLTPPLFFHFTLPLTEGMLFWKATLGAIRYTGISFWKTLIRI